MEFLTHKKILSAKLCYSEALNFLSIKSYNSEVLSFWQKFIYLAFKTNLQRGCPFSHPTAPPLQSIQAAYNEWINVSNVPYDLSYIIM